MTPYTRPSFQALLTRIAADLAAIPAILRAPVSAMWAQMGNGLHGHLDWANAQNSPLTCELERLYDWAALYGVPILLATAASGDVLATGNIGGQLLTDTLARGSNGLDYTVLATTDLIAGNTPVTVRCTTKGAAGNLAAGMTLTLIDPVANVNSTLTVDVDGITGGADDELEADWRARVADEWQTVTTTGARSGKPADYRFWAKSAHPSVTGALVQLHTLGIGTVVVRPVCNGLLDRLPTAAVLDAVSADLAVIAPATADWRVTAPIVHPVTLTIHLPPAVDTAQNRVDIQAALDVLVLGKGGTDAGVLELLWAEIDTAIAVITSQYTLDESGGTITWLAYEIPVLQPINWI
ncbi:MAG: baseplate assembly protein [Sideroxydans sp.]|nr:baseplate assembly protein [Sideroxydans sp.]